MPAGCRASEKDGMRAAAGIPDQDAESAEIKCGIFYGEKRMSSKKVTVVIIVLLIANICATTFIGVSSRKSSYNTENEAGTVQYVMYVGTNDKDTYSQIISTEEAKNIIDDICFKYLEGYTIQDAVGSFVDETGTATHESTIACYFDGADESTIYKIADEVIETLNQNTVLIEKTYIEMDYYGGAE